LPPVDEMVFSHKKLAAGNMRTDSGPCQRQTEGTDQEIDPLVYELYGLTKEEIGIVEGREH